MRKWNVDQTVEYQKLMGIDRVSKPKATAFLDGVWEEAADTLGMLGAGSGTDSSRPPGFQEMKNPYEVLEYHYLDDTIFKSDATPRDKCRTWSIQVAGY